MSLISTNKPDGIEFMSVYLDYSTEVHILKGEPDVNEFPDEYIEGIAKKVNPLGLDFSTVVRFIKTIKWAIKQKPNLERYQTTPGPSIFIDGDSLIKRTIAHGFVIIKTWSGQFPDSLNLKGEYSACMDRDPKDKFSGITAYWNIKFDDTRMKKISHSTVQRNILTYPSLMIGKIAPIVENVYEEPIQPGESSASKEPGKSGKSTKG